MFSAATIGGYLAKPLIKWGLIALVVGGLVLAVIWYRHEADVADRSRAAAELERNSLVGQVAMAQGDAARWQQAHKEQAEAMAIQRAELMRLRADSVAAEKIGAARLDAAQRAAEAVQRRISQMEAEAHDKPEDVHPTGAVARDALRWLCRRNDPAGLPASADTADCH